MSRAAIFDLDGLLVDSEPSWRAVGRAVRAELGIDAPDLPEPPTTGLRVDEVVAMWRRQRDWGAPGDEVVVARILDGVIDALHHEVLALPGVEHAVAFFTTRGYRVGLASSSPTPVIDAALDHFGLRRYFETVTSAEHLAYGKPHPEVLLAAAASLGAAPTSCVVVEDSLNGLVAAKAARMRAIVVPAAYERDDARFCLADLQLSSLDELTEMTAGPVLAD